MQRSAKNVKVRHPSVLWKNYFFTVDVVALNLYMSFMHFLMVWSFVFHCNVISGTVLLPGLIVFVCYTVEDVFFPTLL